MINYKKLRLFLPVFAILASGCSLKFQLSPIETTPSGVYHTVQKGETLWRISQTYNSSVPAIKEANNLQSDAIESGQRLLIPQAKKTKTVSPAPRVGRPPRPSPIIKPAPKKTAGTPVFSWPISGKTLSTPEETKREKKVAVEGNPGEIITTARSGQVFFTGETKGYSSTLIVDHLDGFYSVYGGDIVVTVQKGEILANDSAIGRMASAGEKPVLFFEIRRGTEPVNPLVYLKK